MLFRSDHGGGQALWEEMYADFGVKPVVAGNTGVSMGGWFRREIASLDDVKGLKLRIVGLGAEVWRRLGATPVAMPAGEVFSAFQSGVVDGAELLAPAPDLAVGLQRLTRLYYGPGFDKPNGTGEAIVSTKALEALPEDLQAIVATACREEHATALGQAEWTNAVALDTLVAQHGVELRAFPQAMMEAARNAAEDLLSDIAAKDALSGRVIASWRTARAKHRAWAGANVARFYAARG